MYTSILMPSQVVLVVKNLPANAGDPRGWGSIPGLGKIPLRRAWQPTLVFLPGESWQEEPGGLCPLGYQESDVTKQLTLYTFYLLNNNKSM